MRSPIGSIALAVAIIFAATSTQAFDETKYPDWSGQWRRPAGVGNQWDTSKPPRQGQAPLTPEYQAIYEANLKDQAAGGQGTDPTYTCIPDGMPLGQQTPIMVRKDGDRFVLVEGLHRLEACKQLGEETILGYLVQARLH